MAVTFTGGIDSTTLAYHLADSLDKPTVLNPLGIHSLRPVIYLVAAEYEQANWSRTEDLAKYHFGKLCERYPRIQWNLEFIGFQLPDHDRTNATLQPGGHSPEALKIDYSQEDRTYGDCFIDGRNMILFAYLLSWCSHNEISMLLTGHQNEPREWDHLDSWKARTEDISPMFIDRVNLMNECGFRVRTRVQAPWLDLRLSKYQIVARAIELGIDLQKTYSCIHDPICGTCDNCQIRRKSLAMNGLTHV